MNFLDTYGITGTGTSTPPPGNRPEQSLDEEVSQVIGTLGRFWGGFKKQVIVLTIVHPLCILTVHLPRVRRLLQLHDGTSVRPSHKRNESSESSQRLHPLILPPKKNPPQERDKKRTLEAMNMKTAATLDIPRLLRHEKLQLMA